MSTLRTVGSKTSEKFVVEINNSVEYDDTTIWEYETFNQAMMRLRSSVDLCFFKMPRLRVEQKDEEGFWEAEKVFELEGGNLSQIA